MRSNGINIILADSDSEINTLINILGIADIHPLSSFQELFFIDPDAVYFVVHAATDKLSQLAEQFNIKRGVLSVGGHRKMLGFNVDWMTKLLAKKPAATLTTAGIPTENVYLNPRRTVAELTPVLQGEIERDDPYAELGYHRR